METINTKFKKIIDKYPDLWQNETYKKGELLIKTGKTIKQIFYVKSGVIKGCLHNAIKDKEVIVDFFRAGSIIIPYSCFVYNLPAIMDVQVIDKSLVSTINQENWDVIIEQETELKDLIRDFAISQAADYLRHIVNSFDAGSYYQKLIVDIPFLRNLKDVDVASYLGISRSTLLRIK